MPREIGLRDVYEHRELGFLVEALVARYAGNQDVRSIGHRALPDPERVGEYRPDVTATADGGRPLIGIAIAEDRLSDPYEVERLQACLAARGPDGQNPAVCLAVLADHRQEAEQLFRSAGADPEGFLIDVLTVNID